MVVILFVLLTIVRAPSAWGVGLRPDGANPWIDIEPRISANLRNQFEWPLLFYVVCILLIVEPEPVNPIAKWLAWTFLGGRVVHSIVQIFSTNIRLRGLVFTVNFVAVLGMWGVLLACSEASQLINS